MGVIATIIAIIAMIAIYNAVLAPTLTGLAQLIDMASGSKTKGDGKWSRRIAKVIIAVICIVVYNLSWLGFILLCIACILPVLSKGPREKRIRMHAVISKVAISAMLIIILLKVFFLGGASSLLFGLFCLFPLAVITSCGYAFKDDRR